MAKLEGGQAPDTVTRRHPRVRRAFHRFLWGLLILIAVLAGLFVVLSNIADLRDPVGETDLQYPARETPCRGAIDKYLKGHFATGQLDPKIFSLRAQDPDDLNQRLDLGSKREPGIVFVDFDMEGAASISKGHNIKLSNHLLRTATSEFKRTDGVTIDNSEEQIGALAVANPKMLRLYICLDPEGGKRIVPGAYTGRVTINDDSLREPVVVSLQATLKYPNPLGPLTIVLIAGWLATLFYAVFIDDHSDDLRGWLRSRHNRVALLFGSGALVVVYYAIYLSGKVWGSDLWADIGAIFTSAFTAQISALTTYQGLLRSKGQRQDTSQ